MTRLHSINHLRLLLGLATLLLGLLVYVIERPPGRVYFLPDALHSALQQALGDTLFGTLGQQLPTLLHVLAFSLLTAAFLSVGRRGALAICVGWLLVDTAFEVGQAPRIAPWLAQRVPDAFAGIPVLENTADYFLRGHFDPLDLLSILLGAAAAFVLILATRRFDPPGAGRGV